MPVQVLIPTPLRKFTNDEELVTVAPGTISNVVDDLERQYPGIKARITDDSGELRRFVNIYVNEEDIRFQSGKDTEVVDGDAISIVPAIAGGAR
jgi:molybdopterin synthase sulfur carrier subunit